MSSILRALKKIDEEALSRDNSGGDDGNVPNPGPDNIRRVVNRRARERLPWFKRSHFIVFPVIFLLGAAAVLVFDWSTDSSPQKKDVPVTDKRPGAVVAQKLPPALPQSPAENVLPVKKEPGTPIEKPQVYDDNSLSPSTKLPSSSPLTPKNEKSFQPAPDLKPPVNRATPERTISAKPKPPKINHPNFTLDGILWSQKPERRVAVINGNYYKVGEQIDGVTIFEIKKNVVMLQAGGEKWALHLKK